MSDFDWKSATANSPIDIKSYPQKYIRVLASHKEWKLLIDSIQDQKLNKYVLCMLKKKFVEKNIYKSMSSKDIIELLENSSDVFRKRIFRALITQYDTLEAASEVGVALLRDLKQHLWCYRYLRELFSLQPTETLKRSFEARLKDPIKNEFGLRAWNAAQESCHNFSQCEFEKYGYFTIDSQFFVSPKILKSRKSFGNLLVELYASSLDGFKTKSKKHYRSFVITPQYKLIEHFHVLWQHNKDMREILRQSIERFPFEKIKTFPLEQLVLGNLGCFGNNNFLSLNEFIQCKIISNDFLLYKLLPRALEGEINNIEGHHKYLYSIVKNLFNIQSTVFVNFILTLRTLSKEEPTHALGKYWTIFIEHLTSVAFEELKDHGNQDLLRKICNELVPNKEPRFCLSNKKVILSFDESIDVLVGCANKILSQKEQIVKVSPEKYSNLLSSFIRILLQGSDWSSNSVASCIHNLPFIFLPVDLRDNLVIELMSDPTGQKTLNPQLAKRPTTVPLSLSLLIHDLHKLSKALAPNRVDQFDKYGFQEDITISFPPLQTQETKASEEIKTTVHVFERFCFQSLRHKNSAVLRRTYSIYRAFVEKILLEGYRSNDETLLKRASECHYHLCRFYLGRSTRANQDFMIQEFYSFCLHPLSVYAGMRAHEDYAQYLFDNILGKHVAYTQNQMPFGVLLQNLLTNSYCDKLKDIGRVYAKIAELLTLRLYHDIPSPFNFSFDYYNNQQCNLSCLRDQKYYESYKAIRNGMCDVSVPKSFRNLVLATLYNGKRNQRAFTGYFDKKLTSFDIENSLREPIVGVSGEAIKSVFQIISTQIDEYDPKNYKHSLTLLTTQLIQLLGRLIQREQEVKFYIKDIPDDFVDTHFLENYDNLLNKLQIPQLTLNKHTIEGYKYMLSEDCLFGRLFNNQEATATFELIDKVMTFEALNPTQAKQRRDQPIAKPLYNCSIRVSAERSKSIATYLTYKREIPRPRPKPRKVVIDGVVHILPPLPYKQPKVKKIGHEKWMNSFSEYITHSLLESSPSDLVKNLRYDGQMTFQILKTLHGQIDFVSTENVKSDVLCHLLNMMIDDLLIKDPVPTKENPNPRPPQTLFRNELGEIFKINELVPCCNHPHYQKQRNNQSVGLPQYEGTKALIATLCSIMCKSNIISSINFDLISKKINRLFKHSINDLRKRVGENNSYGFLDQMSRLVVSLVDFGRGIHPQDWCKKNESSIINTLKYILSCDLFSSSALEFINKRLRSLSNIEDRYGVISCLLSVISNDKITFSISFRTRIVSWCLESRLVGCPLPQFCLDYIESLSKVPKLHIDIRRTIAAGIVSFFKYQSVCGLPPQQFDELFEVLQRVFSSSKTQMAPTFCQLIRPTFCRELIKTDPMYKEMMPPSSSPCNLVEKQFFGEISMPRYGEWKSNYEKFVSTFLGANLLSNDQHVLQLTIQVLTKIGIKGGDISSQIATFINKAFEEFSVHAASPILINFEIAFCLASAHQQYKEMICGFVSIFEKTRSMLDDVNKQQLSHVWFGGDESDPKLYDPLYQIFTIFYNCFSSIPDKFKEAQDLESFCNISKRILDALEGQSPPAVNFEPYGRFINLLHICSNNHLIRSMSIDASEAAMSELIKFIPEIAIIENIEIPTFVYQVIKKNHNYMNVEHLHEITTWPRQVSEKRFIREILYIPIKQCLQKLGEKSEEIKSLMPLLWNFSQINRIDRYVSSDYNYYANEMSRGSMAGRGGGRARKQCSSSYITAPPPPPPPPAPGAPAPCYGASPMYAPVSPSYKHKAKACSDSGSSSSDYYCGENDEVLQSTHRKKGHLHSNRGSCSSDSESFSSDNENESTEKAEGIDKKVLQKAYCSSDSDDDEDLGLDDESW